LDDDEYNESVGSRVYLLQEDRPVNPPIRYTRHHPITEVFFDGYVDSSELEARRRLCKLPASGVIENFGHPKE
jgi:hypothetical protein